MAGNSPEHALRKGKHLLLKAFEQSCESRCAFAPEPLQIVNVSIVCTLSLFPIDGAVSSQRSLKDLPDYFFALSMHKLIWRRERCGAYHHDCECDTRDRER